MAAESLQTVDEVDSLPTAVGKNLRKLRTQRGLSLERLSTASGVSRAMLSQVELGQSAPTINSVWKIAKALEVPFSALIAQGAERGPQVLKKKEARLLTSYDGTFTSRALFPWEDERRVEFYELTLTVGGVEVADAHAPGTSENLVVAEGSIDVEINGQRHVLGTGDAIVFQADVGHVYRNTGAGTARLFLVMTYASSRNG